MYVCPSAQALLPLTPERLVGSGRADIRSMRQNGGKTTVPVPDQSVARAMCDRANPCKKAVAKDAGQANGRIRLRLGGLIATIIGLNLLG